MPQDCPASSRSAFTAYTARRPRPCWERRGRPGRWRRAHRAPPAPRRTRAPYPYIAEGIRRGATPGGTSRLASGGLAGLGTPRAGGCSLPPFALANLAYRAPPRLASGTGPARRTARYVRTGALCLTASDRSHRLPVRRGPPGVAVLPRRHTRLRSASRTPRLPGTRPLAAGAEADRRGLPGSPPGGGRPLAAVGQVTREIRGGLRPASAGRQRRAPPSSAAPCGTDGTPSSACVGCTSPLRCSW